jgi:membrane-bound lytic murein transglycosylase D
VAPDTVASLNGLKERGKLRVGQELLIAGPSLGPVVAAPAVLKAAEDGTDKGADVHVVRRGETMWGIARRYGVSPGDLLRWNGRKARALLRPGDQLVVAASQGGAR